MMTGSPKMNNLCTGGDMTGNQCPNQATWINQNGVRVCDHHKIVLDAFTWENRNSRKWQLINRIDMFIGESERVRD